MNKLREVVDHVISSERDKLKPSTFEVRKGYLARLIKHADSIGMTVPCQELYDSFVSRANTPDLRFQII